MEDTRTGDKVHTCKGGEISWLMLEEGFLKTFPVAKDNQNIFAVLVQLNLCVFELPFKNMEAHALYTPWSH